MRPRRKRPYMVLVALVAVLSFALSLMITYVMPLAAYFSLPTRAWQLAGGALVALTAGQWRRLPERAAVITGWVGLALILFACVYLTPATPYPGTAALLPWLGTALVIGAGCATPTRGCGRVLAVCADAGARSVVVLVVSVALAGAGVRTDIAGPPARAGRQCGGGPGLWWAGGAHTAFRREPVAIRRFPAPVSWEESGGWRSRLGASGLRERGVAALGVIDTAAHSGWARRADCAADDHSRPAPTGDTIAAYDAAVQDVFAQVQAAVASSADLKAVPSNLNPPLADAAGEVGAMLFNGCLRAPLQSGQPECAMGDTASKTTVAVVGDSHASMWIPAFQQIGTQRPWRLEAMAKAACPMMDLPIANPLVSRLVEYVQRCEEWRGQIIARLRAEHPKLVMVSVFRSYTATNSHGFLSGFTSYDPAWIDALTRLVRQLRETGAKVLVLGPLPALNTSVPGCLSEHLDDATACSPPMSTAFNRPGIAAEAAAVKAGGGQYADLTELFCTANRCPVIVGNTLVYVDAGHLTLEYSRLLAPALAALADRALAQS